LVLLSVPAEDSDRRTRFGKGERYSATDASIATRNEGNLAAESQSSRLLGMGA
jgi:hypothetical protein